MAGLRFLTVFAAALTTRVTQVVRPIGHGASSGLRHRSYQRRIGVIGVVALLTVLMPATSVSADHVASLQVTTADDDTGAGFACPAASGDECSLRLAIETANADSGHYTITFAEGIDPQLTDAAGGEIEITDDLTVIGNLDAGDPDTTISRDELEPAFRIFSVAADTEVGFENVIITGGRARGAPAQGGGIRNAGALTINNSTITGNAAVGDADEGARGGGVYNAGGPLTITDSTVNGNTARVTDDTGSVFDLRGQGGGIFLAFVGFDDDPVVITDSTITGNTADGEDGLLGEGGGLYVTHHDISGPVTVSGSMISDNEATSQLGDGSGGGIYTNGSIEVIETTISRNTAGDSTGDGGGVFVAGGGGLTLTDSVVSDNTAISSTTNFFAEGGGIHNLGAITITRSLISGNVAEGPEPRGAGIYTSIGIFSITDSTLSDNQTVGDDGQGGGFYDDGTFIWPGEISGSTITGNTANAGGGMYIEHSEEELGLTVSNSTVSGNTAATGGGIHATGGDIELVHVTVKDNVSDASGIHVASGTVTATATILDNNSPNCSGPVTSGDWNLASDNSCTGLTEPNDLTETDPELEPLADNGGPTQTHHPAATSPALNHIDGDDGCVTGVAEDQRGEPRPDPFSNQCDVGAVETQSEPPPTTTTSTTTTSTTSTTTSTSTTTTSTTTVLPSTTTTTTAPTSTTTTTVAIEPEPTEPDEPATYLGSLPELRQDGVLESNVPAADVMGNSYRIVDEAGGVFTFGDATFHGSLPSIGIASPVPIVSGVVTPSNRGYWLLDAAGGVFTFGDATFHGSLPGIGASGTAAVAMAPTPSGWGYWVLDEAGGVFTFGDARFFGSIPGLRQQGRTIGDAQAVAMAVTPSGGGYWVLDEHGGVFAFGDATFQGSIPGLRQVRQDIGRTRVVDLGSTLSGGGYWVLDKAGGVFAFGDATFQGSIPGLRQQGRPVGEAESVGVAVARGGGYWVLDEAGGIFTFGS